MWRDLKGGNILFSEVEIEKKLYLTIFQKKTHG